MVLLYILRGTRAKDSQMKKQKYAARLLLRRCCRPARFELRSGRSGQAGERPAQSRGGSSFERKQQESRSVLLMVIVLAVSLAAVVVQADSGAPSAASVRHRVVAIEVQGNSTVPEDEILAALGVEIGDMISENEARERASAVLEIGKLSNAVPRLEPAAGGRKLVLTVHEYPKVKGYEFSGNTVLSDEHLGSIVSLMPGDVLDTKVLDSISRHSGCI